MHLVGTIPAFSAALIILALLAPPCPSAAQGFGLLSGRNHPELRWQVAETPHFRIVYPRHLAGIEIEAAPIAEASYAALSSNLNTTFDRKIDLFLSDEDEIANGFATPIGNGHSNIWVHVAEYARQTTGRENWLRMVIAHELSHLFHFRKVLVRPLWLNFLSSDPLPRAWSEGLAQYQAEYWTAQRGDRWLRTAVLDDRLSYSDGTSIWNGRLLYAIGNSQVRYLTDRYGDSTLVKILEHRKPILFGLARVHDFETAFEEVVGKSHRAFFDEWRRHVNVYYNTLAAGMEPPDSLRSDALRLPGQYYFDIAVGPDTSFVAVHSLASLRRPVQRLMVIDREHDRAWILDEGTIYAPVAWHPDGRRLAYSRLHRGAHGSLLRDLYLIDRDGRNRQRITSNRRAGSPAFSPDGRRLAFTASERGTENIYIRDLESGAEVRVTNYKDDVQISSLRWHPSEDRIVFDRFTADGRRDIALLDLASGEIRALTNGDHDDRDPVLSPDGESVAYVSLRDGVPNVFIADIGADTPERVTRLSTGAFVTDWLPPDSIYPAGSLILRAGVTKARDRAFRIDAARRVDEPEVLVPEAYASWTRHRAPEFVAPQIDPDSALIERRYVYSSWHNIRHVTTFGLPYVDVSDRRVSDWGILGLSSWIEPLGKHAVAVAGALSLRAPLERSHAIVSYVNNQWHPSITTSLYRLPGSIQFYGSDLLVEAYTGGDITLNWPLDWSDRAYVSEQFEARVRWIHSEALTSDDIDTPPDLPPPDEGRQADVRFAFIWKHQRPYWNNIIHPIDGLGLRMMITAAGRVLGGESEYVRSDLSAFTVLPAVGLHRLFLYGRAQVQFGESFAQNFVGLSRHDPIRITLPNQIPLFFSDVERVRGFRSYALGNRMLFGTIEYRFPLLSDLRTHILGLLELGSVSGSLFADGGLVWTNAAFDDAIRRVGVGGELKNAVTLAGFLHIAHAIGIAQPARDVGTESNIEVYYRVGTAIPF